MFKSDISCLVQSIKNKKNCYLIHVLSNVWLCFLFMARWFILMSNENALDQSIKYLWSVQNAEIMSSFTSKFHPPTRDEKKQNRPTQTSRSFFSSSLPSILMQRKLLIFHEVLSQWNDFLLLFDILFTLRLSFLTLTCTHLIVSTYIWEEESIPIQTFNIRHSWSDVDTRWRKIRKRIERISTS